MNFYVDVPAVIIITPVENRIYSEDSMPLNLVVDKPYSELSYSLDGKPNISFASNTTLAGLTNGEHNITVYAQGLNGNTVASKNIYFTIQKPGFPATLVIGALAIPTILATAVWLRHRKKLNQAVATKN